MTPWVPFFQILCRHRQGYRMNLSYSEAANHPGQDNLARVLYMVPLPEGHPIGLTALVEEWITTGDAECT